MLGDKKSLKDYVFDLFNILVLTLFMLICIYPFYYVFINSISDPNLAALGVFLIPAGFTLESYIEVFSQNNIVNSFMISALRTIIGTVLTVFISGSFAYSITKAQLFGRKYIYRLAVMTMYFNAGLIPWYLTMKTFGLRNSFLLYIIPTAANAFFIILLKTFFEQLPAALEESAMLDGAGYFTIFIRIIMPLSKPILATIIVFSAVGQWNSWSDNFFLVPNEKLKTLQLVLNDYLNQAQTISGQTSNFDSVARNISTESIKMTITIVATLPILLVYPFMQKYFVKGIMIGSVKG